MGFAVDLGRLYLIRGELNEAANAMAIAAAQNLNGTEGALEIAANAAENTIIQTLNDGNQYNFGSLIIGGSSPNGLLNSTVAAPLFYSDLSDATASPSSTNYADGTTAQFAQINLQADAPLLFWSFLSLGQSQKTSIAALAVAGISAPLCTVCSMEDFAVADQSGGGDPVDFGFVFNTKYTFHYDCTGAAGTSTTVIPDATIPIPYVMIDRYNPNLTLDETQQLYRTGAGGLIPLPSSTVNRQFACFTVGAAEFLWGNSGNGGTSTVPVACSTATANAQVEEMLCGLYTRFGDPTVLTACAGVTDIADISTAYQQDSDLNDYDDYTAYGGTGRRIITVPIVDTLSTTAAGTMNVLGFRQFFVTPTPNPNTGLGNDPSDSHGRFNAIYIGSIVPVKQGFYHPLWRDSAGGARGCLWNYQRPGKGGPEPMRQRLSAAAGTGNTIIEAAIFLPVLLLLLIGMEQIAKVTYTYYELKKAEYTVARYVGTQQGVDFCAGSSAIHRLPPAINLAMTGTTDGTGTPFIPNLTADMFVITPERVDTTGAPVACTCDITGCDESAGGGSPDFITVSIPSGYPVQPIIPFTTLQSIPLVPSVKVPYGGT